MEAAARPFPNDDTTPPVTKMYFMIVLSLYVSHILSVVQALVELLADFCLAFESFLTAKTSCNKLIIRCLKFNLAFFRKYFILY